MVDPKFKTVVAKSTFIVPKDQTRGGKGETTIVAGEKIEVKAAYADHVVALRIASFPPEKPAKADAQAKVDGPEKVDPPMSVEDGAAATGDVQP